MRKSQQYCQKAFDSQPVYNKKYVKTKVKSYEDKISTNFHSDKIPKEGSQCICLSVILIDTIYRTGKTVNLKCFRRMLIYNKLKKMPEYITDQTEISSDDSDDKISNEENSNEEN